MLSEIVLDDLLRVTSEARNNRDRFIVICKENSASSTKKEQAAKKNALNNNVIMGAVFGVIGLIVICAYYFLKIRPGKGGSSVADDLEFYDDEEYENEEETEPEFEEESGDTGRKPEKKDEDPKAAPEEGDHV